MRQPGQASPPSPRALRCPSSERSGAEQGEGAGSRLAGSQFCFSEGYLPRVLHRQRSGAHAEAGDGGAPAAPSPPPAVNGHPSGGAGRERTRTRSAAKEKESESGGKRRRGGAARYTPACPPATDLPKPVRERAGGRAPASTLALQPHARDRNPPQLRAAAPLQGGGKGGGACSAPPPGAHARHTPLRPAHSETPARRAPFPSANPAGGGAERKARRRSREARRVPAAPPPRAPPRSPRPPPPPPEAV